MSTPTYRIAGRNGSWALTYDGRYLGSARRRRRNGITEWFALGDDRQTDHLYPVEDRCAHGNR